MGDNSTLILLIGYHRCSDARHMRVSPDIPMRAESCREHDA
jgi:hypothetical protein